MTDETPLTISVPEAGKKYYGLERDGSYSAAARGDIPTVRVGRLLRVPVAAMEAKLQEAFEPIGEAAARVLQHCADVRGHNIEMQRRLNQQRETENQGE